MNILLCLLFFSRLWFEQITKQINFTKHLLLFLFLDFRQNSTLRTEHFDGIDNGHFVLAKQKFNLYLSSLVGP